MSDGNMKPGPSGRKQEDGEGDPNARPPRSRNLTGVVLVLLVLFIVFLVVQAQWSEKGKITWPRLVERLARGEVKSIDVERNKLRIQLAKGVAKGRGPEAIETLALPEAFITEKLPLLEELGDLGEAAAAQSEHATQRALGLLAQNAEAPIEGFQPRVTRRFILKVDDQNALLVKMGQLPTSSDPNDHGGKNDPNHTGQSQAYLFTPQSLDDPKLGKTHDITFDDLLAYTTTDAENLSHGLPPVAELTTDLFLTRGRVEFSEDAGLWETLLLSLLPWLLIIGFLWFFIFRQMRSNGVGGNVLSFGKSRARIANREKSSVTFADVAGVDEAKDEVSEIVEFLKHPGRFARLGGRTPRGVLLVGSPGTGKTLLAKAIAGEAEVPFYSICGSDFVEMFVGVGASRVRDLFKQARENSPCIIFLDEIDAVGRRRGAGLGGGHDEREQTLNAILVEMDGFESDTGIIVIAATNRADVLDPALMRPGRFDREIHVDLPDVKGREAILRVHGRRVKLHPGTDLSRIARATPGFSGAELEAVVNEAAILATLGKKDFVYEEDLEEARDRVRWGRAKNSRIMDDDEKKVTAYHEAGHTLIALLSPEADPIHKVTIIPRGQALGATMYLPEKDQYSLTQNKAETYLKICFGGRIAEELFFDSITSGAANDIKQATGVARRMVKEWGMSPALGPISYEDGDDNVFLGRELGRQVKHSEATADAIDQEVKRIVDAAYQSCHQLLSANRDKLELLAKNLLEYEILTRSEIEGLMAGDTVAAIREQAEASRKELEKVAGARAASLTDPKLGPVGDPEPKFPPGLAGEGA